MKVIRTREGQNYPYVSAQAFRYWLRTTAERRVEGWQSCPNVSREKIAYTDSNPLLWWDDDIFGYMRASKKTTKEQMNTITETVDTVTRVSPLRQYPRIYCPRQHHK